MQEVVTRRGKIERTGKIASAENLNLGEWIAITALSPVRWQYVCQASAIVDVSTFSILRDSPFRYRDLRICFYRVSSNGSVPSSIKLYTDFLLESRAILTSLPFKQKYNFICTANTVQSYIDSSSIDCRRLHRHQSEPSSVTPHPSTVHSST